jgi:hypothetical protein
MPDTSGDPKNNRGMAFQKLLVAMMTLKNLYIQLEGV